MFQCSSASVMRPDVLVPIYAYVCVRVRVYVCAHINVFSFNSA